MSLGAGLGSAMQDGLGAAPQSAAPGDEMPAGPAGSSHSRFAQRIRRRYAQELTLLPSGVPDRPALQATFEALRARGHDVSAALRILRQLVLERLVCLDCEQQAPLEDITRPVTWLAEFALDIACTQAFADLDAAYGAPLRADGRRGDLGVVGRGQLGARERNVSSAISWALRSPVNA